MAVAPQFPAPPVAAEVRRFSEDAPERLLIVPDVHFPVHHERAVNALLDFADDVKPDLMVQLGDMFDVYGISSFLKQPRRMREFGGTLHEEAQSAQAFWQRTAKSCRRRKFLPGNHEYRIEREIVNANPALFGHPAMSIRSMLEIPDDVEVYPYDAKLRVGNLAITHGHNLRGSTAKYAAANVLSNYPNENTVAGHNHRIDCFSRTVYSHERPRTYMTAFIGWLGDYRKAEYIVDPNWQLGFAYVEFWKESDRDRFTFHQIEMVDGEFMFAGRRYG